MRSLLAWIVIAGSSLVALPTAHAYPLLRGLGGPADFGGGVLQDNDDGSSSVVDITAAFPAGLRFFTATHRSLFVNNNGNVTFLGALSQFTPGPFPIADQPMIAPWWADVDTRGPGFPDANGVFWNVSPGRFVATWHNVGYFSVHDDKRNDFQLILTDRSSDRSPGDFDVEFRYDRCEWTTGDASQGVNGFGGTPAQAGFDAGNRRDFLALPGSRTMAILDVCRTSNVGEPGRWLFSIRNGEVLPPDEFVDRDAGPRLLLEGRAGPCFCAVPGARRNVSAGTLSLALVALGMSVGRRRRTRPA